ncbi:MAG: hypothetical protein GTO00_09225 [Deltaproteobacteria bacterium]|nr:hypothetical protein [Deltaproteobacteria bacterium]
MPRKKLADEPIEKKLSLPGSLVEEVEYLLRDPVRNKPRYGAFGALVTKLLRDWVKQQTKETNNEES